MSLTTYSGLKQSIQDYLDRDDLSSYVDDFIDLAEARHKNEVRFRDLLTRGSLTIDARQISYPANFLEAKTIKILTNPAVALKQITQDVMDEIREEGNGKPAYFSCHTEIEFNVTPDTSYTGEIIYYASVTALSDSNTSNAILARSPGLYLFGSLVEAAPFLMHDERIQVWDGMYQRCLDQLHGQDMKSRSVGVRRPLIVGATP